MPTKTINDDAAATTTMTTTNDAHWKFQKQSLVYEIDKVIMNAKHLIDFSNLLKVTQPLVPFVSV